jgi:hypothetical protein
MRRIGNGAGGKGLVETYSCGGKSVESWSLDFIVPVAMNMIGAQRVDGDQENVGLGSLSCRRRSRKNEPGTNRQQACESG